MQELTLEPRPSGKRIDQPRPVRDTKRKGIGDGIYQRGDKFYFKSAGAWVLAKDRFDQLARTKTEALRIKKGVQAVAPKERRITSKATFNDLVAEMLANPPADLKASTLKQEKRRIDNYMADLGPMKVQEIRRSDIREKMINPMIERGLAPLTIGNAISTCGKVFSYAVDCEPQLIMISPTKALKAGKDYPRPRRKNEIRILTVEELQALFAKGGTGRSPGAMTAFALMAFAGLRGSEATGLQWEDVLWEEGPHGQLSIVRQLDMGNKEDGVEVSLVPPKTLSSVGCVDLSKWLRDLLHQHRISELAAGHTGGHVLRTRSGQPYWATQFAAMLNEACERAGIAGPYPNPHHLRHTFASMLISKWGTGGLDLAQISRQLRHESPAVTLKVYAHEFDRHKKQGQAGAAIDEIMGVAIG